VRAVGAAFLVISAPRTQTTKLLASGFAISGTATATAQHTTTTTTTTHATADSSSSEQQQSRRRPLLSSLVFLCEEDQLNREASFKNGTF
jgi:hypothetical protein